MAYLNGIRMKVLKKIWLTYGQNRQQIHFIENWKEVLRDENILREILD